MLRVRNRIKAEKVIERIRHALDLPLDVSVLQPYWKDKSLWECCCSIEITGASEAEIAFTCLILAHRLGNGWYVMGLGGNDPLLVFNGIFDVKRSPSVYVLGVDWAHFELTRSDRPSSTEVLSAEPPR